jgi:lyso-ornithine lipid O-acyltransferase
MPYLRAAAFCFVITVSLVVFAPVQFLARRRGWAVQHAIQTGFCRAVCAAIGVRVSPQGRLPGVSPRLIIANHVSWTDVIALASQYPFVFLAKKEVAGWPVLGFLARLQGTVFVDRGDRRSIPLVNAAIAEKLRAGQDVVVFAEGTSSDGAGVLKFNAAHFAMLRDLAAGEGGAAPLNVTLAPAAIVYSAPRENLPIKQGGFDVGWYGDMTFLPHLWSLMRRGGAKCHIIFPEPVDSGLTQDRKALAGAAEARVRAALNEAFGASPA